MPTVARFALEWLDRRTATGTLFLYWVALLLGTHWPCEFFDEEKHLLATDKLLHLVAYAGLAFLILLAVTFRHPVLGASAVRPITGFAILLAVAGLVDEATQPWVGRDFEWYDWFADLAGIAVGIFVGLRILEALQNAACEESAPEIAGEDAEAFVPPKVPQAVGADDH